MDKRLRAAAAAAMGQGSSDFDLWPTAQRPSSRKTPAAVLIPIIQRQHGWQVILTRRTSDLRNHPGQVAFPGGKQDPADADAIAAALREAEEEIGLRPVDAQVSGSLPPHQTVTGFEVTPILARISSDFRASPSADEVAEVFEVPLAFLMDRNNTRTEAREWQGLERHYYVMPYGPYYVWGATARILVALQAAWEASA